MVQFCNSTDRAGKFRFSQMFSSLGKIVAMIAIFAMCHVGTVHAQTNPNILQSKQTTNTPLIVVDGKEWSGDIISISPDSIESISVLKEQSAVAVYGEKGRNGAVIVTTKLNQSGKVDAPLIVVDGTEWSGDIKNISPESIESISILKDQSAVAVYGEKARNGVVFVTTKLKQSGKVDVPLIVVDGTEWSGDIKNISPESIESISILKDQSAIAVYGEKGKKGVIIITTKK